MDDVIKWVTTPKGYPKYQKVDQALLDKYKDKGYAIEQHDEEFFMVERAKSLRVVTCTCIHTAHTVVEAAILLEQGQNPPETIRKTLLEKALMLIGKIDVMYNCKSGDRVRRRFGR